MSAKLNNHPKAKTKLIYLTSQGCTDKKIQEELNKEFGILWNIETIRRNRNKLTKKESASPEVKVDAPKPFLSSPSSLIDEKEKAEWFREQFKNNLLFKTLKDQFTEEEINIYLSEYGDLCCQFEDIVTSEFFQIDDFLKHRILINRQLKSMKDLQNEVDDISKWLSEHPIKDDDSKDDKTIRIEYYRKLDQKRSDLNKTNDRYDKLVGERKKIYENLAATRKDRVDELKGGRETFINLVALLQNSRTEREKQARYAELSKIASDDVMNEFRKNQKLPGEDGFEPLILDAESFPEEMDDENE